MVIQTFSLDRILEESSSGNFVFHSLEKRKERAIAFSEDLQNMFENRSKVTKDLKLKAHSSSLLPRKDFKQFLTGTGPVHYSLGNVGIMGNVVVLSGNNQVLLIPVEILQRLGCSAPFTVQKIITAFRSRATLLWQAVSLQRDPSSKVLYDGPVILCSQDCVDFFSKKNFPFVFDQDVTKYLADTTESDVSVEELIGIVNLLQSSDADTIRLGCKLFLTANMQAVPVTARYCVEHYRSAFRYVRYNKSFTSLAISLNLSDRFFEGGQNIPLEECLKHVTGPIGDRDRTLLQNLVRAELVDICKSVFDSVVLE